MIRNKIFILLLLLGIGCTKNDHPSDKPLQLDSYIFFDEAAVKTKGNLLEGTALPKAGHTTYGVMGLRGTSNSQVFDVYKSGGAGTTGKNKYDNIAVLYRPEEGETFTYDKLVLWNNETHRFCAFYPYSADCITAVVADDAATNGVIDPYVSYTQPTTLAGMTDVLTAYTEASYDAGKSQIDNLVGLNFNHRLFALDVHIENSHTEKLTITDAVLTVTVPDGAKLYFNGGVVTNDKTTKIVHDYVTNNIELNSGNKINLNDLNGTERSFLFLPCSSLDAGFKLSFINIWGKEVTFNVNSITSPDSEGFIAGKKYTLTLKRKVIGGYVTFEPTVEDWTISDDVNHDFE